MQFECVRACAEGDRAGRVQYDREEMFTRSGGATLSDKSWISVGNMSWKRFVVVVD